jgi:hypothetical protein
VFCPPDTPFFVLPATPHTCKRPTTTYTGAYPYDCPGEALLDVSWHTTGNPAGGPIARFLMAPNLADVITVRCAWCQVC